MFAWQSTVQDEFGNAVTLPVVTVYEADGVTLADIFAEDEITPLDNPFTGTLEGFVQFWADAGQYKIVGASGGDETSEWNVAIDAPALRAETAAAQAEASASAAADSAAIMPALVEGGIAFRRKLHLEVPFHPQSIIDAEALDGAATPGLSPLVYPQYACADDTDAHEIFIWRTKGSGGNYISVLDFETGIEKSTFRIDGTGGGRESLSYRKEGSSRYLYGVTIAGSDAWRVDITTLPASGSIITPAGSDIIALPVTILSRLTWVKGASEENSFWYGMVTATNNPGGKNVKTKYAIMDKDFNLIDYIRFPVGVVGSYNSGYLENLPKDQSVCFHNGNFYFGLGGPYRVSQSLADKNTAIQFKQGVAVCGSDGTLLNMAIVHPEHAIEKFSEMTGRSNDVIENEGIFTAYGKVYAIWQTTGPSEWGNGAVDYGIVITEEMSADVDAVDFSSGAALQYHAVDQRNGLRHQFQGTQITCPVTGTPLGSFDDIITMMTGLDLDLYEFNGYGQTIVDINGSAVDVSGCIVTFKMSGGAACEVTVEGRNAKRRFWVGNLPAATRTQTSHKEQWNRSNDGDLMRGFLVPDGTTQSNGHILHYYGRASHITESTHALELQRTTGPGYLAVFYDENRDLAGGIYQKVGRVEYVIQSGVFISSGEGSPEGAIIANVGSLYTRTDGGAGTTLYVKESGSGNTGWAAK